VFAVGDRLQHQFARRLVATDQFDNDLHIGITHHLKRIGGQSDPIGRADARCRKITHRGMGDTDAATGTASNLVGVTLQDVDRSAADGTEAEQADIDRIHWYLPSGGADATT